MALAGATTAVDSAEIEGVGRPVIARQPGMSEVAVVVPTLNGGEAFRKLARHIAHMRDRAGLVEALIIDSGSTDGTPEYAERASLRVHRIARNEFVHGRTRNLGIELTDAPVVAFLTQDVLPVTPDWPLRFAKVLEDPKVAGVYGRQVPRDAATMEMFFVAMNYPAERLRFDPQPGGHHPRPGRVLFSNAFSAVRRDVMERLPFPGRVRFSEDQIWAYLALTAGYSIVYEPAAEALHAHHYSIRGLFRRSHAVGRALGEVDIARGATFEESVRFLLKEIGWFARQGHFHRLPQMLSYEFIRWLGFQLGRREGLAGIPVRR